MRLAVFAYSRRGCDTARRVINELGDAECKPYAPARLAQEGFIPLCRPAPDFYGELFSWADAMIFVGSCGICVRQIAPWVKDKTTDPAVICVDELGHFVIPILSGHIGGANALANRLATALSAVPVITTATDINHRFSVDAWAARNGFIIDDMPNAKKVSAAILERDIPMTSEIPVNGDFPAGTYEGLSGELGIYVGVHTTRPFSQTLHLIPKTLHLGVGCRKGTSKADIETAVDRVLRDNCIDFRAVRCAASVDLKADEEGLLEFCRENNIPVSFYASRELMALDGEFSNSDFVRRVAGVDCVCERAARMGAEDLIVKKTAFNGVTVAVAAERYEVSFG